MSSSDSEPHNETPSDEWDKLELDIKNLDDPDCISLIRYTEDNRYQMEYGCYRVLKCRGAE